MTGLRFAMVTTFYPPYHFGGDAVFIRRLAHGLARRGHRVDVIHDVDAFDLLRGERPMPEAPLEEPEGVRTHRLRSRAPLLSCLATQQLGRPLVHGRRIRRLLDEGGFDVVHFHNVSLVGGPAVLRQGRGIKLYTAHEHWLVCPTHVLWRHDREPCDERQCLRCQLHHRRPPQLWRHTRLLERASGHVDLFFSPSAWSAARHRAYGFPRELEVMPYFLPDLDSEAEREVEGAGDDGEPGRPYFLFVGRLEKMKGLQDVIPHFDGDAPWDLKIVGAGAYGAELRAQAAGRPRVQFLGVRTPEELRRLYRGAIALMVPTIGYETFGIVALEAFRESTPVIARAQGPLTEIVESSGGGLLFRSAGELRDAMQRLAADPELRERSGRAGREMLHARFTESAVLPHYLDRVRCVAERRGRRDLVARLDASGTLQEAS